MSDSDSMFLTQSSCMKKSSSGSDTGNVLSDVLDLQELYGKQNFTLKSSVFSDISSTDDEELLQCSIEAEQGFSRFRDPLKPQDLTNLVESGKSKQSENKTRWAVNLFKKWQEQREKVRKNPQYSGALLDMSDNKMNEALSYFVGEVRNESGGEYRPNTIYEIIMAIQHYLRSNNRFVSFLDDHTFSGLKSVIDSKMKELSRIGLGIQKNQADVITLEQEDQMWKKNILGCDTPQKLLDTLIFQFGLHFALRAGQEHRNLRFGENSQILLKQDSNKRYLEYREDVSKTYRGGIQHRKMEPKITRAYENSSHPERCIVNLYLKYVNSRPTGCKTDAFYLRPRKYPNGNIWFQDVPVGVHMLQQTVRRLCEQAGFTGHYTNHSLRATAATRLYSAGVDEQLISEKTGHRSAAVRAYKRTSDVQKENISDILCSSSHCQKVPRMESSSRENATELNIEAGSVKISLKY